MSGVYEQLVELLVDRFEVDRAAVGPDVTFEELDVDSLFLVELLLVVQSEVAGPGVKVEEDLVTPGDTIARAAELLEEQISAAAAP